MMNILIAMNSFKGSLSAIEASKIVSDAIATVDATICTYSLPLVDGGTGSLEAWAHLLGLKPQLVASVDALNRPLEAPILVGNSIGYIEMASASGLHLIDLDDRDIHRATTYGTGLLINSALERGCKTIYLGIGGSATHDLGTGILRALGVRFLDKNGQELTEPREMVQVATIDTSQLNPLTREVEFIILCDVNNPLLGKTGAAYTFGPQKGAHTQVDLTRCEGLSEIFTEYFKARGIMIGLEPGDGAAGGIPALLRPLLNAKVRSGADFTAEIARLEEQIAAADLVITGEGQFDEQSFYGKGPGTVIELCQSRKKPVLILTGGYRNVPESIIGCSILAIAPHLATLEEALTNSSQWLKGTTINSIKLFIMGSQIVK